MNRKLVITISLRHQRHISPQQVLHHFVIAPTTCIVKSRILVIIVIIHVMLVELHKNLHNLSCAELTSIMRRGSSLVINHSQSRWVSFH